MSDNTMPERIWAYWDGGLCPEWDTEPSQFNTSVEYIRADVVAAQLAERDELLHALQLAQDYRRRDEGVSTGG